MNYEKLQINRENNILSYLRTYCFACWTTLNFFWIGQFWYLACSITSLCNFRVSKSPLLDRLDLLIKDSPEEEVRPIEKWWLVINYYKGLFLCYLFYFIIPDLGLLLAGKIIDEFTDSDFRLKIVFSEGNWYSKNLVLDFGLDFPPLLKKSLSILAFAELKIKNNERFFLKFH